MSRHLRELRERGLSLLIYDGEGGRVLYSSEEGGLKPLVEAVEAVGLERLRGCIVVDRVVGRAAALVAVYMGASEVHAVLMSWGAEGVLRRFGVPYSFLVETDYIRGRDGGPCPFEREVSGVEDPGEAYRRVKILFLRFSSR
ncbi:MAG: hypothetical protein AYL28_000080 [Candidatus Bathyarchaeota archaeon B23]|nr:MAG: hypothetical protein AYL28_000080 [Candidatus Bathyarchaeota archaeon B23]